MAESAEVSGGRMVDRSARRAWPNELNILLALIIITAVFEILNRMNGTSFLFNTRANVATLFNEQRINIMLLQVAITGIIALGVTQVIIIGGIDLSSGSVVGATAMITMSFAQTAIVNGNPNPKAIFGPEWMDLPVIV
ncbi:MAG TPA: ABC transporter permease, partial [Devosia sp.]|nr:ABC transporter permease [Devosia sp.]